MKFDVEAGNSPYNESVIKDSDKFKKYGNGSNAFLVQAAGGLNEGGYFALITSASYLYSLGENKATYGPNVTTRNELLRQGQIHEIELRHREDFNPANINITPVITVFEKNEIGHYGNIKFRRYQSGSTSEFGPYVNIHPIHGEKNRIPLPFDEISYQILNKMINAVEKYGPLKPYRTKEPKRNGLFEMPCVTTVLWGTESPEFQIERYGELDFRYLSQAKVMFASRAQQESRRHITNVFVDKNGEYACEESIKFFLAKELNCKPHIARLYLQSNVIQLGLSMVKQKNHQFSEEFLIAPNLPLEEGSADEIARLLKLDDIEDQYVANFLANKIESTDNDSTEELIKTQERVDELGEVFTPIKFVNETLDKLPTKLWEHPSKTAIDRSCGNGNFLIEICWRLLKQGHSLENALSRIYGVDIMQDNVDQCRERLDPDNQYSEIVNKNIVCADALHYHYRFDGSPCDDVNVITELFSF